HDMLVEEPLLGPDLVAVAALLLAAVGGAAGEARVALAADHLLLLVLEGELQEAGVHDDVLAAAAAPQAEHQVQRRLFLDVVVGQGAPVLQLLPREDQALLIRRDACKSMITSSLAWSIDASCRVH
uniref:Uncharacterized protein n=1 Tax=Aegilops tauschii subsp. strangulata TaxID=200361 RepID=A0A453T161_AEGTS